MLETARKVPYSELKAARKLFGDDTGSSSTFRTAVRKPDQTLENLQKRREEFGKGNLGQSLYNEVMAGTACESPRVINEECHQEAAGTIDFDVFGDAVSIFTCTDHHSSIETKICDDLEGGKIKYASISGVGKNGTGRA